MTTYIGTCSGCGFVIAGTEGLMVTCENCTRSFQLEVVHGSYSETGVCDDSCRFARGPKCECQCGGDNHCAGYMDDRVPRWVRVRDNKAFVTKIARREAKAESVRVATKNFQDDLIERYPLLTHLRDSTWTAGSSWNIDFLTDMEAAFHSGRMTERQAVAAEKAMVREKLYALKREAREEEVEALAKAGVVVPTGRVTVSGEIIKAEWKENNYGGGAIKATVKTDEGWLVYGTIPRDVNVPVGGCVELKGSRITLTATVAPSDKPLFGFYSRPKLVEWEDGI